MKDTTTTNAEGWARLEAHDTTAEQLMRSGKSEDEIREGLVEAHPGIGWHEINRAVDRARDVVTEAV